MSNKFNIEWIQPWSGALMRSELHPDVLDALLEMTDELIESGGLNYGDKLAGQIKDEIYIEHDMLNSRVVGGITLHDHIMSYVSEYLSRALKQYATSVNAQEYSKKQFVTMLETIWVVSQKENEYNPIHSHISSGFSGVLYLKVPEFAPSVKPERVDDGCITFIATGGAPHHLARLTKGSFKWRPRVGDIFVFPAHMYHTVYPYQSNGADPERRSIAFNANFMSVEEYKQLEASGELQGIRQVGHPSISLPQSAYEKK